MFEDGYLVKGSLIFCDSGKSDFALKGYEIQLDTFNGTITGLHKCEEKLRRSLSVILPPTRIMFFHDADYGLKNTIENSYSFTAKKLGTQEFSQHTHKKPYTHYSRCIKEQSCRAKFNIYISLPITGHLGDTQKNKYEARFDNSSLKELEILFEARLHVIDSLFNNDTQIKAMDNKDFLSGITKSTMACLEYRAAYMTPGNSLSHAYLEFANLRYSQPDEYFGILNGISDEQIKNFLKGTATAEIVQSFVFEWFSYDGHPTHSFNINNL